MKSMLALAFGRTQFHDQEDVDVNIDRENFINAYRKDNFFFIQMKNWIGIVEW